MGNSVLCIHVNTIVVSKIRDIMREIEKLNSGACVHYMCRLIGATIGALFFFKIW